MPSSISPGENKKPVVSDVFRGNKSRSLATNRLKHYKPFHYFRTKIVNKC